MDQLTEKTKRILSNNLFMTLATSSLDNQPWSTPVFYAVDENYNFYWYSRKDTQHSLFIKENPKVSVSIFSIGGQDDGVGLYIRGNASEVIENELEHALKTYSAKAASTEEARTQLTTKEDFLDEAPIRMYKLIPEKMYVSNEAKKWNGKWIDTKSEVKL